MSTTKMTVNGDDTWAQTAKTAYGADFMKHRLCGTSN